MQAYFAAGFDRSPVPQAVLDAAGRYLLVNDAFCALTDRSREALVGLRPIDVTHPSDSGAADQLLADVLAGAVDAGRAERLKTRSDGEPVPVLVNLTAVVNDDGTVDGAHASYQDLRVLHESLRRLDQQRQFYSELGERSRDAAIVADADGRMLYASPAVQGLFGYDPESVVDLRGYDFIHPDDVETTREIYNRVVAEGGTQCATLRVRVADGSWRWVEETMHNLLATPIKGVVCNLVDITERREAERRLELVEARNQAIVETVLEGILVVHATGEIEYANAQLAEMIGLPLELIYTRGFSAVLDQAQSDHLGSRLRERHRRGSEKYEFTYPHPDGSDRILLVSAAPLAYGDGEFVGSVATVTDVTEARHAETELRRSALHDLLTGLPNRTLLTDRLEQAVLRVQATPGASVAVLTLNLDHFKLVNDTRGHDGGDAVLVEAARRVQERASARDTVARLDGDTFVVVAEVGADRTAEDVAHTLQAALSAPFELGSHTVHLSVTIGYATSPPVDAAELLRFSEAAMFAAKTSGRAQIRRFEGSFAEEAERAYALTADLRTALRDGSLEMHYQPIVSLATGAVVGYEALARWTHPSGDAVPPDVFVPVAERTGLARDLDRWAVERGITEFARLRAAGSVPRDAAVAINLSAQHLGDPALVRHLIATAAAAEFPPHQVAIEITEGAVVRDTQAAISTLRALHERGFSIAIDDFGTGYSSMAYLRNFPVTSLKIDRTFVIDVAHDQDALAIITSIVQLARAIGITTTAEGVETEEQAVQLRHLGCTTAQGWLWSRALPAAELAVTNRHYPVPTGGGSTTSRRAGAAALDVREEHGLVRLLELQRQGASLTTIAAALNADGFRAPNGQRWHKMTVARALSYLAPKPPQS